jgi:hypothetical protein
MLGTILLGAALTVGPAHAENLSWDWQVGQTVAFEGEVVSVTARGTMMLGKENLEARVIELVTVAHVSCTPQDESKKAWEIHCVLDKVQLSGQAMSTEQEKLDTVLGEYITALTGATVTFDFSKRGRISALDLEGLSKDSRREALIHEYLRLLISRVFGMLELEMPKDGATQGKRWKQGGTPLVLTLPTRYGTAGGMSLKHTWSEDDASMAIVISEGRAIVSPGKLMEASGTFMADLRLGGETRWNPAIGLPDFRQVLLSAALTGASVETGNSTYMQQSGSLLRVGALVPGLTDQPAPAAVAPATEESAEAAPALAGDEPLPLEDQADLSDDAAVEPVAEPAGEEDAATE